MPDFKTKLIGATCAVALTLGGCSGDAGPRTSDGIFAGALTGGVIGALTRGRR